MAFDPVVAKAIETKADGLGWPPLAFMAIVQVESGGKAFATVDGKALPLILYEPHVFYRCLPTSKRKEAKDRKLGCRSWGEIPYPSSQSARYNQLARAKTIHVEAAYMACSWGVGQVLGENADWLGFPSAQSLAERAMDSIEGQLDLMTRFIQKRGLVDELKALNWRGFARLYNGPGQVDYYAGAMERAFKRLGGAQTEPVDDVTLQTGSNGPAVTELQKNLRSLGFHLHVDGDYGPATLSAVKAFQSWQSLTADGVAGPITLGRLEALLGRSRETR